MRAPTTPEDTDWTQIDLLYGALEIMQPSPVVTLNRAVAVSKVTGPQAALDMIEPLAQRLSNYFHFFGVRGAFLMQLGRNDEARTAFDRAIALANTSAEAAHIRMHLDRLQRDSQPARQRRREVAFFLPSHKGRRKSAVRQAISTTAEEAPLFPIVDVLEDQALRRIPRLTRHPRPCRSIATRRDRTSPGGDEAPPNFLPLSVRSSRSSGIRDSHSRARRAVMTVIAETLPVSNPRAGPAAS